uniref:FKBP12-interacting protein of 37 kDa n=1 Tax=Kalanchoe fedtschenkoi TaxID=63787 RepID=A0A7N0ZS95_KALFE
MASHLDDDDIFGGDFQGNPSAGRSGTKRSFGDLDDDEDDIFGSKKANVEPKETAPGEVTKTILILRESLQNCKESLAACQSELEAAKSEIQKWYSAFQNESFLPVGTTPEPKYVLNYLQTLRSSEDSLKEQLEKAKKKEAAFIVTFAKREQEIAELKSALRDLRAQLKPPSMQARKLLLDPAIHEEFTRLKNLVEEKDKKLKELQDNSDALKFSPNSKMGKMLMAKCRTLMEENEEIGNLASEGKIHELTMKLSLQKSQYAELRNQFEGLYKHIDALTNHMEKSNEMVLVLQESLEEKDAEIRRLKDQLRRISPQEDEHSKPVATEIINEANSTENNDEIVQLKEVKVEDKVDSE